MLSCGVKGDGKVVVSGSISLCCSCPRGAEDTPPPAHPGGGMRADWAWARLFYPEHPSFSTFLEPRCHEAVGLENVL